MTIADDIEANANTTFRTSWTVRESSNVPEPLDLKLSNDGVHLNLATILHADLDGSTNLVEKKAWQFSGRSIKHFCTLLRG